MHKYVSLTFCIVVLHIIYFSPVKAQIISADSTISHNEPLIKAVVLYDRATQEGSGGLYNGIDYHFFPETIKGTAYLPGRDWQKGNVSYDHINYYNVWLIYDIVRGLVISKPYNDVFVYSLITDKVGAFSVAGHDFKRILADTTNNTLETGFYEILYKGNTEVLLKRETDIQERVPPDRYFAEHFYYYLRHNGKYYKVSSKGSVLSALKDKKGDLQQYIKRTGANFGDNKEKAIVDVASHYDEITK